MNNIIYMDHSATTFVRDEVLQAMLPYFTNKYGNASSVYSLGIESKMAIENARRKVADCLSCEKNEIYFTSCGTESNNWALKGIAYANRSRGNHIITSSIEHHSIINTCKHLEGNGFEVTYLPVNECGVVSLEELKKAICDKTILVSIMFANNEIGTIQPIDEIAKIVKQKNIYLHTDAVQAVGNIQINVNNYNLDLLSLSGHKFYGPKGVGALFIRKDIKIHDLIHGGAQEVGKRGGTENVANIVGLGKAIELASKHIEKKNARISSLTKKLVEDVLRLIPDARLNGHPIQRLPGNANLSFKGIKGKELLLLLDKRRIAASSGSACTCGSLSPSHVLLAIGLPVAAAYGSVRFTLGEENTSEEIDYVVSELEKAVKILRDNF